MDYLLCGNLPYPAWKKHISVQNLSNRRIRRYLVCRLKRPEARDFSHVRFTKTYQPESIIVYGSFADGSANLNSDFDALIIAGKEKLHDSSFVDGVVLDVFIYPPDQFLSEYDPAEFAQVWDGKIILDKNGMGGWLKKNVLDYIEHIPLKTAKDVSQEIKWCEKMLLRTMRGDVEGYYRWHWLLCDSLEIYFDIKGIHYYGPKKALHFMEESDSEAFHIYSKALLEFNQEGLSDWINYLKTIF